MEEIKNEICLECEVRGTYCHISREALYKGVNGKSIDEKLLRVRRLDRNMQFFIFPVAILAVLQILFPPTGKIDFTFFLLVLTVLSGLVALTALILRRRAIKAVKNFEWQEPEREPVTVHRVRYNGNDFLFDFALGDDERTLTANSDSVGGYINNGEILLSVNIAADLEIMGLVFAFPESSNNVIKCLKNCEQILPVSRDNEADYLEVCSEMLT